VTGTIPHFLIFGPLKKAPEGYNFMSNDDVQENVVHLWGSSPRNNLQTGYANLCKSGTLCLNARGSILWLAQYCHWRACCCGCRPYLAHIMEKQTSTELAGAGT